jgi:Flp pilus assembly pilin Flp
LVFEVLEQARSALECGGFADARAYEVQSNQDMRSERGGEQPSTERRQNGAVNLTLLTPGSGERNRRTVMKRILGYLKDERGIETLEWIAIGALILGVAFVVYPGTLQGALTTVVGNISTALSGITLAP